MLPGTAASFSELLADANAVKGVVAAGFRDGGGGSAVGCGTEADAIVDAWFVDGAMPVMDGAELMRRLRGQGVRAPLVAVTGNALDVDREQLMAAGATAVLAKPVTRLHEALAEAGLQLPRSTPGTASSARGASAAAAPTSRGSAGLQSEAEEGS